MNACRNKEGQIVIQNDHGVCTRATVPATHSMVSIFGMNEVVDEGKYDLDGWVYVNGVKKKKWHVTIAGIRVWEPKLKNLVALHTVYKKLKIVRDKLVPIRREILNEAWKSRKSKKTKVVRLAAVPTHRLYNSCHKLFVYTIENEPPFGLIYSWDRINEKDKVSPLGQKLYDFERRSVDITRRYYKIQQIFYHAMINSLPPATFNKVYCLQFGEDKHWFRSKDTNINYYIWEHMPFMEGAEVECINYE